MNESNHQLEKVIKVAAGNSHKAAIDAIREVQITIQKKLITQMAEEARQQNTYIRICLAATGINAAIGIGIAVLK